MEKHYGVYRVMRDGRHKYISRTVTSSRKLAEEIARDLSNGIVVMPDGATRNVSPFPHIAKPVGEESE